MFTLLNTPPSPWPMAERTQSATLTLPVNHSQQLPSAHDRWEPELIQPRRSAASPSLPRGRGVSWSVLGPYRIGSLRTSTGTSGHDGYGQIAGPSTFQPTTSIPRAAGTRLRIPPQG